MHVSKIIVIGSGTMGLGIAQWFCQQRVEVHLVDRELSILESASQRLYETWKMLSSKGKFSESEIQDFKQYLNISLLENIPADAQLAIEAVFEDLALKQELMNKLAQLVGPQCALATNTSSFLVKDVQAKLPADRRATFLGLHFFNPAPLMKLVEVVQGPDTQAALCSQWAQWFQSHGKEPAQCQDSPGFIVNRLARGFYGESLRIAEELPFAQIDQVMREVGGFKMGPFELLDLIGVDVNLDVTRSVWKAFGEHPRFAPHRIQEEKVRLGQFGRKTKRGFYEYP